MRLVWGELEQRRYEAGVDRGVLYPQSGPGVVWNGLLNVEAAFEGGETNSYYYDGIKYIDLVSTKDFQATLTAFSAPEEFSPYVGDLSLVPGFVLTRQPRGRFGLSYRTGLGGRGYKLHLVYNALASPNGRGYVSLSETPGAGTRSWKIDSVPPNHDSYRPSAHFIFDSTRTDPYALALLESILYGTDTDDPRLPRFNDIYDIVNIGDPLIITPESVTGLAELVPGTGDLYKTSVAGIHRALPDTRLFETFTRGLYGLE